MIGTVIVRVVWPGAKPSLPAVAAKSLPALALMAAVL